MGLKSNMNDVSKGQNTLPLFDPSDLSRTTKERIARETHSSEMLVFLAKDEYYKVRAEVAGNKGTPKATLMALARDENWGVQHAVAGNPFSPVVALIALSRHDVADVRIQVAYNINSPKEALETLNNDEVGDVRYAARNRRHATLRLQDSGFRPVI